MKTDKVKYYLEEENTYHHCVNERFGKSTSECVESVTHFHIDGYCHEQFFIL